MANLMSTSSLANPAVFNLANSAKIGDMIDLADKYEHYRRRFREAMDARNLTNEEMASRLVAHPVTISKMRGGKIELDDEWRARISVALNIDEDKLFGDQTLPAPKPAEIFRAPQARAQACE